MLITVTATLSKFDTTLVNAAAISGAGPVTILRRVTLPIIAPGVVSGATFAFGSLLDEIVATLFIGSGETQTVPRQMWVGLRGSSAPPSWRWRPCSSRFRSCCSPGSACCAGSAGDASPA